MGCRAPSRSQSPKAITNTHATNKRRAANGVILPSLPSRWSQNQVAAVLHVHREAAPEALQHLDDGFSFRSAEVLDGVLQRNLQHLMYSAQGATPVELEESLEGMTYPVAACGQLKYSVLGRNICGGKLGPLLVYLLQLLYWLVGGDWSPVGLRSLCQRA